MELPKALPGAVHSHPREIGSATARSAHTDQAGRGAPWCAKVVSQEVTAARGRRRTWEVPLATCSTCSYTPGAIVGSVTAPAPPPSAAQRLFGVCSHG